MPYNIVEGLLSWQLTGHMTNNRYTSSQLKRSFIHSTVLSLCVFMVVGRDDSGVFALQNYEFPQQRLAIKDGIVIHVSLAA